MGSRRVIFMDPAVLLLLHKKRMLGGQLRKLHYIYILVLSFNIELILKITAATYIDSARSSKQLI